MTTTKTPALKIGQRVIVLSSSFPELTNKECVIAWKSGMFYGVTYEGKTTHIGQRLIKRDLRPVS